MPKTDAQLPDPLRLDAAGPCRRRRPPMPRMRLDPLTKASLIGLRVLLVVMTAMAGYAAFHGVHV
ncbi:MAG TPA: hypothetical protein VK801_10190 [Caulobacteraceae bacterium]|nr:hypothetical protein [Caulobacteraceae bacterium]